MLALPFARNTTNMASHSAYPGQNGYSAAGGDSARTFEQQPTAQAPPHMNNGPVPHEHDQDSGNFLNGFSLPFMPSVFGSRVSRPLCFLVWWSWSIWNVVLARCRSWGSALRCSV